VHVLSIPRLNSPHLAPPPSLPPPHHSYTPLSYTVACDAECTLSWSQVLPIKGLLNLGAGSTSIHGSIQCTRMLTTHLSRCPAVAAAAESDEPADITVNLEAVAQQNPLLACSVLEAALHVAPDYNGAPGMAAGFSSSDAMQQARKTCCAAAYALPILAEVTAAVASQHAAAAAAMGAAPAKTAGQGAPGPGSDSSVLQQKLFSLLVAAVKYARFGAALTPATGHLDPAVLGSYYNSIALLGAISNAAFKFLGPGAMAETTFYDSLIMSMGTPLLWLQALGRVLLAAGQLLQQAPQFVVANGRFVCVDDISAPQQSSTYSSFTLILGRTVERLHSMLLQGGEAAAAVEAGSPAAAATPVDLARLLQLAADLQQQLDPIAMAFYSSRHEARAQGSGVSAAMQQLYTACQEGGLPQKLYGFGVACCAAFPQRGCCGNPACTNLGKFTETALASHGCSGCDKVSMQFNAMAPSYATSQCGLSQGHQEFCILPAMWRPCTCCIGFHPFMPRVCDHIACTTNRRPSFGVHGLFISQGGCCSSVTVRIAGQGPLYASEYLCSIVLFCTSVNTACASKSQGDSHLRLLCCTGLHWFAAGCQVLQSCVPQDSMEARTQGGMCSPEAAACSRGSNGGCLGSLSTAICAGSG
jgi:hypothetical protein